MSNRRRTLRASRSYSTRLAHRSLPRRQWRWWEPVRRRLGAAWLAPVLAVLAEVGHLIAAFLEWPESAPRGAYHVLAGALLGLVAAAVASGRSASGARGQAAGPSFAVSAGSGRVRLGAGVAVAAAGPALWLAGALLGTPVYGELPVPAAAGIAAGEVALAAVLVRAWRAAEPRPAGAPVRATQAAGAGAGKRQRAAARRTP